jgi:predicted DNA-binding transcriptional regulator YafY
MKLDTNAERSFRRRIRVLSLLDECPRSYDDIIAVLDREHLLSYDSQEDSKTIKNQQRYQFRNDLRVLKLCGYRITCNRKNKTYTWHNSPFGLSFAAIELNTLSLLCDMFRDSTIPHADDIRAFLTSLIALLPEDQQKIVKDQRIAFSIDLRETTDYRNFDQETLRQIEMAIQREQQLEFTYCSPSKGQERRHIIEPQPLIFKDGHVYLRGRHVEMNKALNFRLDYIVPGSAEMLRIKNSNNRPFARTYQLRYWLGPAIARHSVSEHFPGQEVERHADGSATITAKITDLFEARRIVLSYGFNCIVYEPPELVEQMRQVRDHFDKSYPTLDE